MTEDENERPSRSDRRRNRAALSDALPAVIVLVVLQAGVEIIDPEGTANTIWSLLPLLPALWLVWAQGRNLGRADEFQRILQLEAMAIGFGATMVLALTGGLLDAADVGDPRQSLQITFIGGLLSWLAALAVKGRAAG